MWSVKGKGNENLDLTSATGFILSFSIAAAGERETVVLSAFLNRAAWHSRCDADRSVSEVKRTALHGIQDFPFRHHKKVREH